MNKKYSIFITALFCAFLFGFGIAHFILPDKDFSEQENRYLSQFKAPTLETVRSGSLCQTVLASGVAAAMAMIRMTR